MEFYAKIFYEYYHGKKLDLNNPVKYVEKLQWLKVYFHPPILNQLVDKYEVRSYVEEKIFSTDHYIDDSKFNGYRVSWSRKTGI